MITMAIFIALIVLLSAFVLIPNIKTNTTNKKAISDKTALLDSLERKNAYFGELKNDSGQTEKIKENLAKLLPDKDSTSSFIVALENLANSKNIIMSNLAIAEGSKNKAASQTNGRMIEFSFDTNTDFDNGLSLVRELENFSRLNTISTIQISHGSGNSNLSIKITGSIYYD